MTFDVYEGEVLGLIGRNGSGKSTLLKILNRITHPSEGRVALWGRVGSLLEVGTGFHPELTGRENVFLNGAILGMSRREIAARFDEIVDFAGVERFLDTPVKRYSSGMHVRLAFAVAAHLQSEILLIDEVLAVGDRDFQERCISRVHEVAKAGRSVIMVSHNMESVRQFSDRCLLLEGGRVRAQGAVEDVLDTYAALSMEGAHGTYEARTLDDRPCVLRRAEIVGGPLHHCGENVEIDLDLLVNDPDAARVSINMIVLSEGAPVGALHTSVELPSSQPQAALVRVRSVTDRLAPGEYTITIEVGATRERESLIADDVVHNALHLTLAASSDSEWFRSSWHAGRGSTHLGASATVVRSHATLADEA